MINSKNMTKVHSSYWMKDWDDDTIVFNTMNESERKSHDLYKLAASKRAISNFVNIVTNQQIPVKFSERGNSYTDGKAVVIGSTITDPKDFDIAVGLALHEGSHIKLSNFDLLQRLETLIPQSLKDTAVMKGVLNPISTIKDIWNYVEDRRIDWYVFNQAPGYREYYRAMYDKYFNDPLIDKGLKSDEYTDETIEAYMFRIINLHNKNTDLTKLGGLRKIYSIIGLGSINRLQNTQDTLDIAMLVFEEILNHLPPAPQGQGQQSQSGEGQSSDGEEGDNGGSGSEGNSEMGSDESDGGEGGSDENGSSEMGGDSGEDSMGGSPMSMETPADNGKPSKDSGKSKSSKSANGELSDTQKKLLDKKIEKQKDFVRGKINKKAMSRKEVQDLNSLEESGTELKSVGDAVSTGWGKPQKGIECIVVNKLTESLMNSDMCPLTYVDYKTKKFHTHYEKEIADGIRIGTMLGKKLQVRGESRTTIFNRQKNGRIDKRLISSLGFGNENVFQYAETDSYKKANLHLSIDASGSMSGIKWKQTLTNVTALCKAVDMIQNLSIQVSIRTTDNTKPYVVIAYDSRVDKFSKVKKLFPGLNATGTTPEGLCYEAIMKMLVPATNDVDSYFLNISDGEPYYSGRNFQYQGDPAFTHTQKMVKQIEGMGIKTLSYFVDEMPRTDVSRGFRKMYGKGAQAIDVTNVSQITKTMNSMFLSK
jgi:hypothetical protein